MWRKGLCVVLISTLLSACATPSRVQPSQATGDEALGTLATTVFARGAKRWVERNGLRDMKVLVFFYSVGGEEEAQRVRGGDRQMALTITQQLPQVIEGIRVILLEEDALDKLIEELKRTKGDLFTQTLERGRLTLANVALIGTTFIRAKGQPVDVLVRLVEVEKREPLDPGGQITLPWRGATWCEQHSPWCWLLGVGGVLAAGAIAAIASSSRGSSSKGGAGGAGGTP